MTRYLIFAAAVLALCAGIAHQGYRWGVTAERAAQQAATDALRERLFDAAEVASRRAAEIEALRAAQTETAMEAEDAARADNPDTRRPAAGSLHRLRARWGADTTP